MNKTTKTAQFTPGPWVPYNSDNGRIFSHWYIRVDGGPSIVTVHNGLPDNQDMANAHLIAAAPAMYAALQRLFNGNVDCGSYWKVDVSDIQAAKEALAQAEGRQA